MRELRRGHLYSAKYDATLARGSSRELLSSIRLDTFLAGKLVLTDAQALIGQDFLELARSEELLDRLPVDRLEIRSRAETLEASLVGLFQRPDGRFRELTFASLPVEDQLAIHDGLKALNRGVQTELITDWRKLPRMVAAFTGKPVLKDALTDGWAKFIERLAPRVVRWDGSVDFKSEIVTHLRDIQPRLANAVATPEALRLVKDITDIADDRNDLVNRLTYLADSEEPFSEKETIYSAYNIAYNNVARHQHMCEFYGVQERPRSLAIHGEQTLHDDFISRVLSGQDAKAGNTATAVVPLVFMDALADATPEHMEHFYAKANHHLAKWYAYQDADALTEAAKDLLWHLKHVVGVRALAEAEDQLNRPRPALDLVFGSVSTAAFALITYTIPELAIATTSLAGGVSAVIPHITQALAGAKGRSYASAIVKKAQTYVGN
jgi:hypothetical protein